MRKRSEVAPKGNADDRTVPMFEEPNTIDFYKCPKCGLKQSKGMLKNGACASCGTYAMGQAPSESVKTSAKKDTGPAEAADRQNGEPGARTCEACGNRLTRTHKGWFYPCGHENGASPGDNPRPDKNESDRSSFSDPHVDEGSTVTATWGEEKFTPIAGSYSTCTIGPFSLTAPVRAGEKREGVLAVLQEQVRVMAEVERKRKLDSFVRALTGARRQAEGG